MSPKNFQKRILGELENRGSKRASLIEEPTKWLQRLRRRRLLDCLDGPLIFQFEVAGFFEAVTGSEAATDFPTGFGFLVVGSFTLFTPSCMFSVAF